MTNKSDIFEKLVSDLGDNYKKIPSVLLDESDESGKVLSGLMNYFGEDDTREAVEILIKGKQVGFMTRDALYDLVSVSEKGIGSLEPTFLLGMSDFKLLELHCPEPGCTEFEFIIHYDAGLRRKCPKHPNVFMELMP